jgi:hypothetical protein
MRWMFALLPFFAACGEEPEEAVAPPIEEASACGDLITGLSMTFEGVVGRGRNQPEGDVEIVLEDRYHQPASKLGTGTSLPDGTWALSATDIEYLDRCWGTTDFVLVATKGELSAELEVSREMHGAVDDGTMHVDLTTQPLVLKVQED